MAAKELQSGHENKNSAVECSLKIRKCEREEKEERRNEYRVKVIGLQARERGVKRGGSEVIKWKQ
jgi:hypothetical protein